MIGNVKLKIAVKIIENETKKIAKMQNISKYFKK